MSGPLIRQTLPLLLGSACRLFAVDCVEHVFPRYLDGHPEAEPVREALAKIRAFVQSSADDEALRLALLPVYRTLSSIRWSMRCWANVPRLEAAYQVVAAAAGAASWVVDGVPPGPHVWAAWHAAWYAVEANDSAYYFAGDRERETAREGAWQRERLQHYGGAL